MSTDESEIVGLLSQIRDLLARLDARAKVDRVGSPSTEGIAASVRAELARGGHAKVELIEVLGISAPTLYGKVNGKYAFSLDELAAAAAFLNTTSLELMEAAVRYDAKRGAAEGVLDPRAAWHIDPWEQPARARRRH
ncbi:hypothetical protein Q9S78_11960 [Microbacterium sp. KSW-18]|uniref:HTH cro/C1-type domain-containing protein n=1 Tax=Microbacterium aquilitoris TaxID=3067307 RepID=A0ABU3GL06_9MICO|nr:hypothetical protein [Microbacterium sp. KSW-18]MDT3331383.1 hypothetical protein [Microbacterium sp. KSW-18]